MPFGQELERAPIRTGHYHEHLRYEGIRNGLMKQVGGDVTLRDVGPGAEDRWDFWMPSTPNRPYGRYSPGR